MSKRPLDETVQREIAVVLAALPNSAHRNVTDLGSVRTFRKLTGGYANLVYEINDRSILRVFFRAGWQANFENECRALAMLRGVPGVPQVIASGILPLEWPCPYLLVNKRTGDNAFATWLDANTDVRQDWATGIAAVLRRAHTLPVEQYGPLVYSGDVPQHLFSWQAYHDKKMADFLASIRTSPLSETTRSLINEAEVFYAAHRHTLAFQVGPRLVHGDVRLHNIIVDGPRMNGLIDWEWAHGGEPEEDLVNFVRFSLFPDHEASGVDERATRAEYAPLLRRLLSAYPELAIIPDLPTRLTLYLIEADLGQLCVPSETISRNAEIRLREWLHGGLLAEWIAP